MEVAKPKEPVSYILHMTELLVLHTITLILCLVGLHQTKRLKFSVNFAKNGLDEKLLFVTFFITVFYLISATVLNIAYMTSNLLEQHTRFYLVYHCVIIVLETIQVIVQTYFLHDTFYRCCHHELYEKEKPGQVVIALLAALNFSIWMICSFQVSDAVGDGVAEMFLVSCLCLVEPWQH